MADAERKSVLFLCLGNICRSPLAEGVLRQMVRDQGKVDKIKVDSAGTGNYHVGSPPNAHGIGAKQRAWGNACSLAIACLGRARTHPRTRSLREASRAGHLGSACQATQAPRLRGI